MTRKSKKWIWLGSALIGVLTLIFILIGTAIPPEELESEPGKSLPPKTEVNLRIAFAVSYALFLVIPYYFWVRLRLSFLGVGLSAFFVLFLAIDIGKIVIRNLSLPLQV